MKKQLLTLLTALLLAVVLPGCGSPSQADHSAEGSLSSAPDQSGAGSVIHYPGFTDRVLDQSHHTLTLSNDEANEVNFVFVLTGATSGQTLYTSDPMEPGQSVTWDAIAAGMGTGSHAITIETTAVQPDGTVLNSVSQTITVTLSAAN